MQHQEAVKALAPVVDASELPDHIATLVSKVMANENVKAVAGAKGVTLTDGVEEEKASEIRAKAGESDEDLARRLQLQLTGQHPLHPDPRSAGNGDIRPGIDH